MDQYEELFDLLWFDKFSYLKFPSTWSIKIVPPYGSAVVTFFVRTDQMKTEDRIAVYLDCFELLRKSGDPCWKVYPFKGETFRCSLNETDELLEAISEEIKRKESNLEPFVLHSKWKKIL